MIFHYSKNPAFSNGRFPIESKAFGVGGIDTPGFIPGPLVPVGGSSKMRGRGKVPLFGSSVVPLNLHPVYIAKKTAAVMANPETKAILLERTVNNLKKTNPEMAKAIWNIYQRDPGKWLKASGSAIYSHVNGLGDIGDWSDLFGEAAKSIVSAGTQYAAASAQQKLNIEAAQKAADIQNKQAQLQIQGQLAQAQTAKQQAAALKSLQPKTSVLPYVLSAIGLGGAAFVGYKMLSKKKKK